MNNNGFFPIFDLMKVQGYRCKSSIGNFAWRGEITLTVPLTLSIFLLNPNELSRFLAPAVLTALFYLDNENAWCEIRFS